MSESEHEVAIIADKETGMAFKSIGIQPLHAQTKEEAGSLLREVSAEYKIIFVTEDLAQQLMGVITEYASQPLPIIIEIPSFRGSLGLGREKMKRITERAVGADILFREE
jgi:V/A-type H+-transporting ATPase subunit F